MHIKFTEHGTGSATSARDYLFGERDHTGEFRTKVELLRGSPDFVTDVANTIRNKWKYKSAVIAWHKDDDPTPEQMDEVLDEFERVAFAGLDSNQYTYYAVLHVSQDGSKHIHIITASVELQTGKAPITLSGTSST